MSLASRRRLAGLIAVLLILFLGWNANNNPQLNQNKFVPIPAGMYEVINIDDGDTIKVDMNGREEKIRLIGVDTPETHDPRKPVQCFGMAATNFTRTLIGENPVRLEADPLSTNRDRYNRLLRYVYLGDGTLVQAEIIKHGYGFAYTSFPFTKSQEFRDYQKQAIANRAGLWADCNPAPNDFGGYDSNPE
jgi:micrococcal nuclease